MKTKILKYLDEAEGKLEISKSDFDISEEKIKKIKNRVSQLDAALKEIEKMKTEEDKEKIVKINYSPVVMLTNC